MAFGKRQIIAAFLEKDNVKLLAFEISGKSVSRIFGGQVSFGEDTLRDAFIADPVKFSTQVKGVLAQKPPLSEITEGYLFLHPDKTFIKALPPAESVDAFVRSLPFFKEELVIQEPAVQTGAPVSGQVNYVAFEKKLVEDFERPFLESGKKILTVNSAVSLLVKKFPQTGRYLLVLPFEKDVCVAACQDGVILDIATFPKDVWVGRLNEFRMGKGFSDISNVFVVGALEMGAGDKLRNEQHLNVTENIPGDVYDLSVQSVLLGTGATPSATGSGPKFQMPKIPGGKFVFLILAAIIGFVLAFLILKSLLGGKIPGTPIGQTPSPTPSMQEPTPSPTPEAKPADFKVIVLNGTTVPGEAGALGETLTGLGYDVIETANATTSGFVATRLRVTQDVPESIITQLKETILETYKEVTQEELTDSDAQVEIIIGEKK